MIGVFTSHYRTATTSAALYKPINCAVSRGSSEGRGLYPRLPQACLTKYELGSNRCSRFDLSCNQADYFRGFSLTAGLIDIACNAVAIGKNSDAGLLTKRRN